jgi:hypothetical protein
MLMIVPKPRATNAGTAAYVSLVSASTFKAIIRLIAPISDFSSGAVAPTPALFTSRVTSGSSRRIRSTAARSPGSLRSAASAPTLRPVSSAI